MSTILKLVTNGIIINFKTLASMVITVQGHSVNISERRQDNHCTVNSNETPKNCEAASQKKDADDDELKNSSMKQSCNINVNDYEPPRKRSKTMTADNESDATDKLKPTSTIITDGNNASEATDGTDKLECSVCLQPCVLPVQLPCDHIFCYLCVKGHVLQQKNFKCALCRQEIPQKFLNNPHLIPSTVAYEGTYQWYYKGRNGWWQYDDRTSEDIETFYNNREPNCEVTIAGFQYIIDFKNNLQLRKGNPGLRRHIKRDLVTIPKKGVAGIGLNSYKD